MDVITQKQHHIILHSTFFFFPVAKYSFSMDGAYNHCAFNNIGNLLMMLWNNWHNPVLHFNREMNRIQILSHSLLGSHSN